MFVQLEIGIDDRWYVGADGGGEFPGLLRRRNEIGNAWRPFEHRQKRRRPDSLEIRMPVLGPRHGVAIPVVCSNWERARETHQQRGG